jgi:TRAP transporter TAXI family solute receptor
MECDITGMHTRGWDRPRADRGRRGGVGAAALVGVSLLCAGLTGCRQIDAAPAKRTLKYLTYLTPTSTGSFSADLVSRVKAAVPNADVVNEETSGSLVVLSSLQEGKGDFGFSLADAAYVAYRRGIEPNTSPYTNVRAIAVRWVNSFYAIVPGGSPYRTPADFRGKRVAIMPRGSAGELLTRLILEAHGLTYADVKPSFIDTDQDRLTALREGRLDVVTLTATPVSSLPAEITRAGFRVIPLQREVVNRVRSQYPFVKIVPLERELAGQSDLITVGVDSVLVCRADLEEPLAYALTKAFYGLLSDLARAQPGVAINPGNASATPIPLHPGAARFYREQEISNES